MGISTLHSYKASIYVREEKKIDGDGSKNMSYKVRWLSCNLHCHYFSSLNLFKTGQLSCFCSFFFFFFFGYASRAFQRIEILSSCYLLYIDDLSNYHYYHKQGAQIFEAVGLAEEVSTANCLILF